MICGEVWPDEKAPDGRDVTCHLQAGHGGFWHSWWHQIHTGETSDGAIQWPTALHGAVTANAGPMTPTLRRIDHIPGVTHEVVPHPAHVMLHSHRPAKP